jgi:hypothetical protein
MTFANDANFLTPDDCTLDLIGIDRRDLANGNHEVIYHFQTVPNATTTIYVTMDLRDVEF